MMCKSVNHIRRLDLYYFAPPDRRGEELAPAEGQVPAINVYIHLKLKS